jgi:hypothetical protein
VIKVTTSNCKTAQAICAAAKTSDPSDCLTVQLGDQDNPQASCPFWDMLTRVLEVAVEFQTRPRTDTLYCGELGEALTLQILRSGRQATWPRGVFCGSLTFTTSCQTLTTLTTPGIENKYNWPLRESVLSDFNNSTEF